MQEIPAKTKMSEKNNSIEFKNLTLNLGSFHVDSRFRN